MNRSFTFLLVLILFAILSGSENSLVADPPGFAPPQSTLPANEVTHFNAALKGMRNNIVIVEKADGTEAFVALPDSITAFQFVAKATPAFLQRGMLIRFTANFGPGGVPLTPVDKVTLFQPVDLRTVQGRAKQQYTPGIYSDANQGKGKQPMVGNLSIVGRLIGLTPNGVLAVQAGNVPVQVPVNASTQLEVRFNNLALAQEGDPVAVAGFYQPPNENQIKAERITVTTDRIYGEYKPVPEKKSRRKRGKDGKTEKDEGEKGEALGGDTEKGDDEKTGETKDEAEKTDL